MPSDVPIVATIFGTFGWVVYTISTNIRKAHAARAVADLHSKLLDKCAASQRPCRISGKWFRQKFLESAGGEGSLAMVAHFAGCRLGSYSVLAGIAELIVRSFEQNPDTSEFLLISGAVALAIGVGFLVSAVTSFALSKSWGLLAHSQAPK